MRKVVDGDRLLVVAGPKKLARATGDLERLGPAGRAAEPTGRLIFGALFRPRLVPSTATTPVVIPEPPPLQARLDRLDPHA